MSELSGGWEELLSTFPAPNGIPRGLFYIHFKRSATVSNCFLPKLKPQFCLWYWDKRCICWFRPPRPRKGPLQHFKTASAATGMGWATCNDQGKVNLKEIKITCNDLPRDTFPFQPVPKCTEVWRASADFKFWNMHFMPSEITLSTTSLSGLWAHVPYFIFKPLSMKKKKGSYIEYLQTQEIKQIRGKADFSATKIKALISNWFIFLYFYTCFFH